MDKAMMMMDEMIMYKGMKISVKPFWGETNEFTVRVGLHQEL